MEIEIPENFVGVYQMANREGQPRTVINGMVANPPDETLYIQLIGFSRIDCPDQFISADDMDIPNRWVNRDTGLVATPDEATVAYQPHGNRRPAP